MLLFGDGTVEDTLDGGPGVPDGLWRVVGISHEVANEILGMWARTTCGLQDEQNADTDTQTNTDTHKHTQTHTHRHRHTDVKRKMSERQCSGRNMRASDSLMTVEGVEK